LEFLSGEGAARYGGRWNRIGIRAVYASLDLQTAIKEAFQNFSDHGFKIEDIKPRVIAGVRVSLQALLDLTNHRVRRRIGFTFNELVNEDWRAIQDAGEESWTQAIGRGCRQAGFEGLIAPSSQARPSGRNLVYFPDRLRPQSRISVIDERDLPPHP